MSKQPSMIDRLLGLQGPGTIAMSDGAGTDGVPDPEPWDTAEGEQPTGEYEGTFPEDPDDGRYLVPDPAHVRPVKVERLDTHKHAVAQRWRTGTTVISTGAQPARILSESPTRVGAAITNESATDSFWVAPDPASLGSSTTSRRIKPGQTMTLGHTAEVWMGPSDLALGAVEVSFTEEMWQ